MPTARRIVSQGAIPAAEGSAKGLTRRQRARVFFDYSAIRCDLKGLVDSGSEGFVGDGGFHPDEFVAGFGTSWPCSRQYPWRRCGVRQ